MLQKLYEALQKWYIAGPAIAVLATAGTLFNYYSQHGAWLWRQSIVIGIACSILMVGIKFMSKKN